MALYSFLAVSIVFTYVNISSLSFEDKKFMRIAILIKVFGAIAFLLIYQYYFGYLGDAHSFYRDAIWHNNLLRESPLEFINYAFGTFELKDLWATTAVEPVNYHKGSREFFVTVMFSFVTLFGVGNYYASTILFALITFGGYWLLYRVFSKQYPKLALGAFLCVFCLPSTVIWGSGMVKENLILALLGVFLYHTYQTIERRKISVRSSVLLVLAFLVIAKVKIYVVISLLPAIFVWVLPKILNGKRNIIVRKIVKPILVSVILVSTISLAHQATQKFEALSFDNFIGKAQSFQDWHYKVGQNTAEEHGRGSSYTLGDYEATLFGTFKMIPASINVTYFRPYLWEVKSPIVVLVALESLILFLFFIYILSRKRLYTNINFVFSDSFLFMLIVYALILGFLVGFTSYNFGALDRYKIPAMPFFIFALAIVYHKIRLAENKIIY